MTFWPFVSMRVLSRETKFDASGRRLQVAIRRTSVVHTCVSGAIGALLVELFKAIFHNWYLLIIATTWLYITVIAVMLAILVIVFLVMKARIEKPLSEFLAQNPE